ncbi:zinc-binding dehydrogenase [Haloechinothrix halophila]|uniref:Zn-dependent oxidoreductase, NADPH:quinone reductase n=1 Tax=Haloechinothrix halophila YIM 93223 TaxID=592678 RepID=W9DNQ2_9PSEU|nr:zinc-binding dehydrogenase [Haloechinothrix halophila]ETA66580.1 Zn-dependent oxidoreductase, NADPH:quinone reductase [Haloechinothrix halophila YIM 93223]
MRAIVVNKFGGPEVLELAEVAEPVPGKGQVVIDVEAVDVLFLETQLRSGQLTDAFDVRPPFVPGGAVAGRVWSVGPDVDTGLVSRRVAARTAEYGGYAEQAVAAVESTIPVPEELGLSTAASLLHDGPTALGLFDNAAIRQAERVLVTAAAGGLGLLLVQLASAAGARVIGAARGGRKRDAVLSAGAHDVVDYSETDWLDRVRAITGGKGVDVVFDGAGGAIGSAAFAVTARGGRFSAHGAASGDFAEIDPDDVRRRDITLRGIEQAQFAPAEARAMAERALAYASSGRFRPLIGATFPLADAARAHRAIEQREVLGKTLLTATAG